MSAPYRMLAFDLDGTLLEADGTLAAESAAFLRELAASGVVVTAATGRRLQSALPHLRKAGLAGPCVVHNGGQIADVASGATLALEPLPAPSVAALIERLELHGFAPLLFSDAPRGPREIVWAAGAPDPTGFLAWYARYAAGHCDVVAPPLRAGAETVLRVVTHGDPTALAQLVRTVETEQRGAVRGFVQEELSVDGHRAEFLARAADKWSGAQWVAQQAAIEPAQIVAVGDDNNDVELLAGAGCSLAAPDSSAAAVAAADVALHGDGPRAVVAALRRLFDLR